MKLSSLVLMTFLGLSLTIKVSAQDAKSNSDKVNPRLFCLSHSFAEGGSFKGTFDVNGQLTATMHRGSYGGNSDPALFEGVLSPKVEIHNEKCVYIYEGSSSGREAKIYINLRGGGHKFSENDIEFRNVHVQLTPKDESFMPGFRCSFTAEQVKAFQEMCFAKTR